MSALVLGTAAAAALLVSWAHLRPGRRGRALPLPSLQNVRGPTALRRRRPPLEEIRAWAPRLLALCFAAAGVLCARAGCGATSPRAVALIDPASGEAGWARARALGAASLLGFDGEAPRAEGESAALLAQAAAACSATRPACLVRAAAGRPIAVAGAFGAGWEDALAQAGAFAYLRVPAAAAPPTATHSAEVIGAVADEVTPATRAASASRASSRSVEARLWAAALAVARKAAVAREAGAGEAIAIIDDGDPVPAEAKAVLLVVAHAGPATPEHPEVTASQGGGALLADPGDLAAGVAGLDLRASLRFAPGPAPALAGEVAMLVHPSGPRVVAVAATAEDEGRWAHEGTLVPLSRALLASLLTEPVRTAAAPPGGAIGWHGEGGAAAPVGVLDLAPGVYIRDDGRVRLDLARAAAGPASPLDDAALARLGGAPWRAPPSRPSWATLLLALAAVCWLVGAAVGPRRLRSLPAALSAAALLAMLLGDAGRTRLVARINVALLDAGAEPLRPALAAAGVPVAPPGASAAACTGPQAQEPCSVVARIGSAASPPPEAAPAGLGADALVFAADRPRLQLLSVRAPAEVPLGAAAALEATVRVRRGAGLEVVVTAHPAGAAAAAARARISVDDEVRTVRVAVTPLLKGTSAVVVEARLVPASLAAASESAASESAASESAASESAASDSTSDESAADARAISLVATDRPLRRLVLAASPGWEARAAVRALDDRAAGSVASLTRVGASSLLARGTAREDPRALLSRAGALRDLDTVVLVAFAARDLAGPPAAALRGFLARGGAVVLLGGAGAAEALGWPAQPAGPGPMTSLAGDLGEGGPALALHGYAPPPRLGVPAGAEVLARLGAPGPAGGFREAAPPGTPWIVGRAEGRGRLVAVTAPDLFRLSAPAGEGPAYRAALLRAVGWAEAARPVESGQSDYDLLPGEASPARALLPLQRARLREAAARTHRPFLEPDGVAALAAALRRVPAARAVPERLPLRSDDATWALLAALVAAEALLRRGGGAASERAQAGAAPAPAA